MPQPHCLNPAGVAGKETSGAPIVSEGKPGEAGGGPSLLRYLGNKLIVFGQMCSTVDTTVSAVTAGQVAAESLCG